MAYFKDEQEVYETIGKLFTELASEPQFAEKLKQADTVVQYRYKKPEAVITVKISADGENQVDFGETSLRPEVIMSMDADTAHRFWLGKINVPVAIARGQIRTKGPVAKVLKLIPIVKPAFGLYRQQLEASGRQDLLN